MTSRKHTQQLVSRGSMLARGKSNPDFAFEVDLTLQLPKGQIDTIRMPRDSTVLQLRVEIQRQYDIPYHEQQYASSAIYPQFLVSLSMQWTKWSTASFSWTTILMTILACEWWESHDTGRLDARMWLCESSNYRPIHRQSTSLSTIQRVCRLWTLSKRTHYATV